MRAIVLGLCRLLLRVYFRRIEVEGRDRIPSDGPVVFAGNHPNGLIDPLFVLCLAPRAVTFLAKEPLFRMPLVGWFVRVFGCLPVYRRKDGANPAKNREMIRNAVSLLSRGRSLALFPEGISHNEPNLQPLRPGVARLALAATAEGGAPVHIVPTGLDYEAKGRFRSVALLTFGEPIDTPTVAVDEAGEPAASDVKALTDRVFAGLQRVTLTAHTHDALDLARMTEAVLGELDPGDNAPRSALARRIEIRKRVVEGYERGCIIDPASVSAIVDRVRRFHDVAQALGAPVGRQVAPSRGALVGRVALDGLVTLTLAPIAIVGVLSNWPTYRLVGALSVRYAKREEDVLSTIKAVGGLLLFPATWLLFGGVAAVGVGDWRAAGLAVVVALAGFAALLAAERATGLARRIRTLSALWRPGPAREWLTTERNALRRELLALGDRVAEAHSAKQYQAP